jgi:putative membrane protein
MPEDSARTDSAIQAHVPAAHVSEHLANERTYLAYLRTAISLMSFGIAINRFSLYLEQSNEAPRSRHLMGALVGSEQLGIGMVLLGMTLLVVAASRYGRVLRQINAQDFRPRPGEIWILTGLVLSFALGGVVWLILG